MVIASQQCRVCGNVIPSGFTHCDACYDKSSAIKSVSRTKKPARGVMKRFLAAIIFVTCAATLAGCETMKGAGKDLEAAGKNIQKSAN